MNPALILPWVLAILSVVHPSLCGAQQPLQLKEENKFSGLLERGLEPSGVTVLDDAYYVVFDNRRAIGQLHRTLIDDDATHQLIGGSGEQGFEGITYDETSQRFFTVIETTRQGERLGSSIVTLDRTLNVLTEKPTRGITFTHDNKGFEGIAHIRIENELYLLLLCEGNKCTGGKKGRKRGKGRIHVFKERDDHWAHVDKVKLPRSVDFEDYSGLDIRKEQIAITSQQDARLWVGEWRSKGTTPTTIDVRIKGKGDIYRFHEDNDRYCNIEGVSFTDDDTVVLVSDRKKASDPDRCNDKDQSIHVFSRRDR